ncbi:MAG: hypothetical protein ABL927_02915 [Bdellovibrionales bacterium]
MFHWVEIALNSNPLRYNELSSFLNDQKFENKVDFIETTEADLLKNIEEIIKKYDGIRIGRGLGEIILPYFVKRNVAVDQVRSADTILKLENNWWLRANVIDGFIRVLSRVGESFDLNSPVLVVGAGAAARSAITSLFMLGFNEFVISNLDISKAEIMVTSLRRINLGSKMSVVAKDDLIHLPGVYSILVNTTPMTKDNSMLAELYYFNFFKAGGLAIDFSIAPVDTPLLEGAKEIGAKRIYGYQVAAQTDLLWCEQITGRSFEGFEYEERLKARLLKG